MYAPRERNESGPSSLHRTSCSSSSPSPRNRAPNTPPQIQLAVDAVTASNGPGFSGFFPWVQHGADQSSHLKEPNSETAMSQPSYVTAFEQRDASYLPSDALQSTGRFSAGQRPSSLQAEPTAEPLSSSDSYHQNAALPGNEIAASQVRAGHFRPFSNSSLDHEDGRSPGMTQDSLLSPFSQSRDAGTLVEGLPSQSGLSFVHTNMVASSSSPLLPQRQLSPANLMPFAPIGSSRGPFKGTTDQAWSTAGEILDMYSEDQLPGYQVRTRGLHHSNNTIVIRIPRQLMGWKAVLMNTSDLHPSSALHPSTSDDVKARRSSKVLGKQGWEVRQEALKNSYDFRRGSGIWATMHAGHRLFKHDWHVIVKDGSRYVWRMDKTALALFSEDDDSKVGEFCKAVPSSEEDGNRIGSFRFEGQRSRIRPGHTQEGTIFGLNLALASLVAVFGARGGHESVSAAFEPSTDPRRDVLEQKRQEEPDREEVMLALPRPGFARDAESVLSDTTDEDAGEPAEGSVQQRSSQRGASSRQMPPLPSSSHSSGFRSAHIQAASEKDSTSKKKKKARGRKRFSSFFGRSSAPVAWEEEGRRSTERAPLTDAQRIARQYRTQSVMLGS